MDNVDKLINTVGKLARAARKGLRNLFWTDFELEELPPQLQERLVNQPDHVQQEFLIEYEEKAARMKKKRNFSAIGAAFFMVVGGYPIAAGLLAYLWHMKEHNMPTVAAKTLKQSMIKHGLLEGTERDRRELYKLQRRQQKRTLHQKGRSTSPRPEKQTAYRAPFRPKARKTEEPTFDPTNLTLETMQIGYLVDYDFSTWEVISINQYDWDDGTSEKEYKLSNVATSQSLYLHLHQGEHITASKMVNLHSIDTNLQSEIIHNGQPYNILTYQEKSYYKENPKSGVVYNLLKKQSKGQSVKVWEFFDGKHQEFIKIEQFGRNQFNAVVGKSVIREVFTDILPKPM